MTWCPICGGDGGCFCTMRDARKVIVERNKELSKLREENAQLRTAVYICSQHMTIVVKQCLWETPTTASSSEDHRWCDSIKLPISFNHKECEYYSEGNCASLE